MRIGAENPLSYSDHSRRIRWLVPHQSAEAVYRLICVLFELFGVVHPFPFRMPQPRRKGWTLSHKFGEIERKSKCVV